MAQHPDGTSTDTTVVSQSPLFGHESANDYGYDDSELLPRRGRVREDGGSAMSADGEAAARDKFGGISWGASFFGWLVAVEVAALLTGAAGATAAALGTTPDLTPVGSRTSLVAAAVLLVLLLLGYYAGGYVAGRMSRFDGGLQGFGVWLLGLVVAGAVVGLGVAVGPRYDLRGRVDVSAVAVSTEQLGWQILAGAGLLVLAVTLLAAVLGGSVGHRYHDRVDRVVHD